jgi:serine/threonine protein kinase
MTKTLRFATRAVTKTLINGGRKSLAYPAFLEMDIDASFRLTQKLGEGGFGALYQASVVADALRETFRTDTVAVKIAKKPANKTDDEMLGEFQAEVAVLFMLQRESDNIVRFFGCSRAPMAMVMKSYAASLLDYVKQPTRFPMIHGQVAVYAKLMMDMLNGLEAVHGCGLCHRDIKCVSLPPCLHSSLPPSLPPSHTLNHTL